MNNLWIQLIIVAFAIGAPALNWIVQQLSKKAKARKAELQREAGRREMLRTGRVSPQAGTASGQTPPAQARLEEIAARRRAQLQELRRRQQERMRQQTGQQGGQQQGGTPRRGQPQVASAPSAPGPAQAPGRPAGQVRPGVPRPPAPRVRQKQQQRAAVRAAKKQQRKQANVQPAAKAEKKQLGDLRRQLELREQREQRETRAASPPEVAEPRIGSMRFSRQELRRAIILRELLGPPVSLRETESGA